MAGTILFAQWEDPETQVKKLVCAESVPAHARGKAEVFDKEKHGEGNLYCPCPGCDAPLQFNPQEKKRAGRKAFARSAHFKRKANVAHDRASGCDYPNKGDDLQQGNRVKEQNKMVAFFAGLKKKYIYLNSDFFKPEHFQLPHKYETRYLQRDRHLTAKRDAEDRTFSVNSAKDIRRLFLHKPFDDPFYRDVFVVTSGYTMPFSVFVELYPKPLFNRAFQNSADGFRHPIITQVRALPSRQQFNDSAKPGRYMMACLPEKVKGRTTDTHYNVQPFLVTDDPSLFEAFTDSTRYMIMATEAVVDAGAASAKAKAIRAGSAENNMPVYLTISHAEQIIPLPQ